MVDHLQPSRGYPAAPGVLGALTRYAMRARREPAGLQCELCASPIEAAHEHVVDLDARLLSCACRPCALLFEGTGDPKRRRHTVPHRVVSDPKLRLLPEDPEWRSLEIPVRLAFLLRSSRGASWVAIYPSPGGPAEAPLAAEVVRALGARTRLVEELRADVEGLLISGLGASTPLLVLITPVDVCYALSGLVRGSWRGIDGGAALRSSLDTALEELRGRAKPLGSEVRRAGERGGEG